ncbi:MAG: hypothetical protein HY909_15230 [Deltaproteobacteria bacterium]|nr:hypothetical protein [Deltaproteobacteria bacterium]
MLPRRTGFALALLTVSSEALAIPPQAAPPPTTVEVRAVQVGPWRNPSAVLHALRRDAQDALSRCPVGPPASRGPIAVHLERTPAGHWSITVATTRRELRACIAAAVARVAIPPREATPLPEDPPERVTFELLLGGVSAAPAARVVQGVLRPPGSPPHRLLGR